MSLDEVRVRSPGAQPGLVHCGGCGAIGRLPEFEPPHKEGCEFGGENLTRCERCGVDYDPNEPDPCLGRLPGVIFACCGHGAEGYITFANNICIRFDLDSVEAP